MSAPDNPRAFPNSAVQTGMTLRDWFAGQVAPAILGAMAAGNYEVEDGNPGQTAASHAYKFADMMLAERSKA